MKINMVEGWTVVQGKNKIFYLTLLPDIEAHLLFFRYKRMWWKIISGTSEYLFIYACNGVKKKQFKVITKDQWGNHVGSNIIIMMLIKDKVYKSAFTSVKKRMRLYIRKQGVSTILRSFQEVF